MLISSIVFALLLSEIILRLTGQAPLYVSPERDRFWKYDSLLGWAHQPGQVGIFETPQFRTTVHINLKGLRDSDHLYERTNDTRRILVLGDSFAWGYGVEETQRFSQLLETSMGVEVINAGVSGYSTDQELLWFREEGVKYKPDLVLLIFAGNDIGDNELPLVYTIYNKPEFVLEDGHLILKNYPVPKTNPQGKLIYNLSQRSALFYFLVLRYFDLRAVYKNIITNIDSTASAATNSTVAAINNAKAPFRLTIDLLHEINMISETMGAKLLIVATDRWWNSPSGETYKDFIDTLNSEGFFVLDIEAVPGFDRGEMLIPGDGHWSAAGHEFVASKIKDFIDSNQLLVLPRK